MFFGCENLRSIDVRGFDTRNVNRIEGMFGGCASLTEIDLSNNTALTDLSFDVTGLQSVDLSKNVALTKLSCIQNSSLTNLDVSKNKA